ncbi:ATP-binding protein [Lysobacter capsici]|uniref:ATP-binding protein n=1 Tax=Lysobacter capsici TaxID=435897 RepID=UPI00069BAF5B|nr:ATP-binding protein [Lysobacter capsici]
MFAWLDRFSIRRQLWGLFALFLLAGASVLVIDEIEQQRARRTLQTLQDDALLGLRLIKTISDGYGLDVVDTTFRVRNDLVGWDEGLARVEGAQRRIDQAWLRLQTLPHSARETEQLHAAALARHTADAAAAELRAILRRRDLPALGRFADTRLYPAIDPLTQRLQILSDLELTQTDAVVRADLVRSEHVSLLRLVVSLLALGLAALIGRRVLRNASRGIDRLTWLARRMRDHDYTAEPGELPSGELGAVMQAFIDMRRDVLGFETELTGQLIRNERTRAELERRERFQASLLDSAQTAILAVDGDGRFTLVNPFAERLLGVREADLVGHESLQAVFEPRALKTLAAELSSQLEQPVFADWTALRELARSHAAPRETRLRHRNGTWVPALLAVSLTREGEDDAPGLLVVAADLSALKRLERALRASEARAQDANRAKSSFLAAMSHEIRTPMIGVTGMIEVLSHSRLDPEQRHALEVIQHSSQSLLQIIGDILDFSKIEAGRLELATDAVNLPALLRTTVAGFLGAASSRGVQLSCHIDPRIAPAHHADALRLRQIVGNFLSNAVKFTERGVIQVALEYEGRELANLDTDAADADSTASDSSDPASGAKGHSASGATPPPARDLLCLRVTDTGIGISAEQQQRLFEPFNQADGDTTRRYGGTGLGLAICKRLAELMGGQISLHSEPGIGTTLRLRVALARASQAELDAAPAALPTHLALVPRPLPDLATAERERSLILLIDDHPTNRLVIARQLALAGYACEAVASGEEGLQRWRSGRYALLLSDVHMPGLDGYGLARALREEEARAGIGLSDPRRTPILALTASALKGEAEACLAAGMDDCLIKPIAVARLAASLRQWLPHTAPSEPPPPSLLEGHDRMRVLDVEVLRRLLDDSDSEAGDVLDDFLTATAQDLADLHRAHRDGDLSVLQHAAHRIRGAAQLIGAVELSEAADALEQAARAQDWNLALPLLSDVETAVERLRRLPR